MVKAMILGIVWCVVLYFVGCFLVGAVAGAIAGATDPDNASAAGAQAGAAVVSSYRLIIFLGAIAVASVGTSCGVLPGTQRNKAVPADGA
jgi:amino acid transporter